MEVNYQQFHNDDITNEQNKYIVGGGTICSSILTMEWSSFPTQVILKQAWWVPRENEWRCSIDEV